MKYEELFQRNIGIFTQKEQEVLRNSTVTIAGVGGVGGIVLERLVRLGVENFIIGDPEKFEANNFNRQMYSNIETIGLNKARVLAREVKKINPNVKIKCFENGINRENVEEFVQSDIIIDAIEYNLPYLLFLLHKAARERNKMVLAAQAIGFGATLFVFSKDSIAFEDYIGLKNANVMTPEKINNYKIPIKKFCPIMPKYVSKTLALKVFLRKTYIPSCSLGVMAAASLLEIVVIKQLLEREKIRLTPKYYFLDFYNDL